jgi:hypothetical protein
MKFLYPQFLWALFALLLPLIVHLFNFRKYKTLYFSNTRILRSVKQQSNSTRQLQKFLVLLSRMLAIAALVLAFAQPYFPVKEDVAEEKQALAVYLDNSLSMFEDGANGALLNEAKLKAANMLKALPTTAQVQILNNEFEGRQQRYYSPDEAISLLDQTQTSYSQRTLPDIINRVQNLASRSGKTSVELFLFSDFQVNAFEFEQTTIPEAIQLKLVPFAALEQRANVALDSAWLNKQALVSGVPQQLNVQLRGYGIQEPVATSISLQLNGKLYGTKTVSLQPDKPLVTNFNFLLQGEQYYKGKLSIDAPAPYFDNTLHFALNLGSKPNVVAVAPSALHPELSKILGGSQADFNVFVASAISMQDFQNANTLLLSPEQTLSSGFLASLENTLQKGGNILLFPGEEAAQANAILAHFNLGSLGEKRLGEKRASEIQWEDPYYKDAFLRRSKNPDLPVVQYYFETGNITRSAQPLLMFSNNNFLLARIPVGRGNVLIGSTGLATSQSNLLNHKSLVPVLLNSINTSVPQSPLYNHYGSAQGQSFETSNGEEAPLYISTNDSEQFILPQRKKEDRVQVNNLPSTITPGVYEVLSADEQVGNLALNSDALESNWQFLARSDFPDYADIWEPKGNTLEANISNAYSTQTYWHLFLLLALLFFMVELFLLKYTK